MELLIATFPALPVLWLSAVASAAGSFSIKGQRQITNKTAEGTAIKFQVAANEASDIYIGDMVLLLVVMFLVLQMVQF